MYEYYKRIGLVEKVLALFSEGRIVHGSEIHDVILEFYYGKRAVDSYETERIIDGLVEARVIEPTENAAPTHSQAAFAGLVYFHGSYPQRGWVAGLKTHFYYQIGKAVICHDRPTL
jgi:hypothetical protein